MVSFRRQYLSAGVLVCFNCQFFCFQWKVSTILMGLYSFMLDTSPTNGSVETTDEEKRAHAAASLEFNTKDK